MHGRLLHLVLFILTGTATMYSQTYPDSFVCHGDMAVGEIPNSPFTADIVVQKRPVLHDGSLGPLFYSRTVGYVARDAHGKVATRMSEAPDDPNWKPGQKDPNGWHEIICDPRTKTITHVMQSSFYALHGASTLPRAQVVRESPGRRDSTDIFTGWHYTVPGREDLGAETFENLPAHRGRVTKTYPPRTYEYVDADDLAIQLLHSVLYSDPSVAVETRLTNLRFTEPSKNLMSVPSWALSRTDTMPPSIAPPGTMLGVPPSPFPNP